MPKFRICFYIISTIFCVGYFLANLKMCVKVLDVCSYGSKQNKTPVIYCGPNFLAMNLSLQKLEKYFLALINAYIRMIDEGYADAFVFHIRDMTHSQYGRPKHNPNVYNVFFNMESPPNTHLSYFMDSEIYPNDFFNLSMTYRYTSDIYCPYDQFESFTDDEKTENKWTSKQVDTLIRKKRLPILYLVSNCETPSNRKAFVDELQKYIAITQFGKCNGESCDKKCEQDQIEKHYFYLAFENSVCTDYATEKFWRLKKLIVPIVLQRDILERIVPNQYFIAANDFNNVSGLVTHLKNLMADFDGYIKYLSWYQTYKKSSNKFAVSCFCSLCERVHKKLPNRIADIKKWWEDKEVCHKDYGEWLVKRL